MGTRSISSRNFTRDVAAAKQAANEGPVFITDRGKPAHVLLTIADYERITGLKKSPSLLVAFDALPDAADIDLPECPRRSADERQLPDPSVEP